MTPDPAAATRRPAPPRFDPAVVAALIHREWRVFRRVWFTMAFGSIIEPVVFFVAFGFGFGALVAEVAGLSYLAFMATGTVAIGVLFSSMFPGLINGYFRRHEQRLYEGVLAAPVSIAELVTGEALWNGLRVTVVAVATLAVAVGFGVSFRPGVVLVPAITVVAGFGFAAAGGALAALMRSTHDLDLVIVGVVVPMFLIAGTFFPVGGLPGILPELARLNPLYHCVELLRAVSFGRGGIAGPLAHLGVLVAFDGLAWFAAVRLLRRALID